MKKLTKNPHGFSILEIILVITVIGLIGFISYYAYSQSKKSTNVSQSSPSSSPAASSSQSPTPTTQPTAADPYAGWKTYNFKGWFSFKYPADYHISTEGEGNNTIAITSYTYNPNGTPTDFRCTASGFSIPPCDVKVELTHKADGSIGSAFFPENTQLKSTAELIIASAKNN